ncbi:TetR/AcrR family transcriptional regulator C-terminal domain-containing protein [Streptosporangium roseum]|uniref:Transcriptional regulator, GntR family n=1 Tax=Streptosporangium roseum (strain ATCC 12428 / DSM 43021 / JCM 3005 / KCTC 9067 / NCIMB 10171 / NRRL 2505 / NI 9100) TaxID=479432 RepID=D2B2Z3_STRRD|nr:TetR/AcrR family transcriptional regulator C-terminal domain-containing protein [Streptosporangium roseum]ACZ85473.1 putative transcriptional regulator, GntR family [Streptosporangium roseum DSM 43021]
MAPQPDPPYVRIVTEIRRRIADAELEPGDRVPSTRRIAREWGVALATATKALTVLRQEGLVRAEPRVGTVVAETPPARAGRRPAVEPERELTRERVVRAAIAIADAEGLAALSMRGVAAKLGVSAMSPYRHVSGKDDLVMLMADAAYGEGAYPADVPPGWRPRLELSARLLWALYRRHPWLAQITPLTRPLLLPNLMTHAEWALDALDGYGLDPETMMNLHVLVYSYVQGIAANLEREAQAEAATGLSEEQWMDSQEPALAALAASGDYPTFVRVTRALGGGYDLRLDELFEFGLQPMLDGLAVVVESRAASGTD